MITLPRYGLTTSFLLAVLDIKKKSLDYVFHMIPCTMLLHHDIGSVPPLGALRISIENSNIFSYLYPLLKKNSLPCPRIIRCKNLINTSKFVCSSWMNWYITIITVSLKIRFSNESIIFIKHLIVQSFDKVRFNFFICLIFFQMISYLQTFLLKTKF